MINGHGNDGYNYPNKIIADFSSNVACTGVPEELYMHLSKQLHSIMNYPDPEAGKLRMKIAHHYNLPENFIKVTNGSTEAFYLLAHLFKDKESLILTPSFSEYEDSCRLFNHKIEFTPNIEFDYCSKLQNDILWIGNPNNPDGKIYSREEIRLICENNPDTILIIDEAYSELCLKKSSCIDLVKEFRNIIIIRSLTKTFSIPGLRLGFVVLNPELAKTFSSVQMPWTVGSLALVAGNYIFDNYSDLVKEINPISEQSVVFQKEISQITNLEVFDSECNFFLIRLRKGNAKDLKQFLVSNYGILIRNAENFRGLDHSYFRVSVQSKPYNSMLIKGIKEWMK